MAYKKREKIEKLQSLVVGSTVCAEFFGISQPYLRKWKKNGCPNQGYGLWNLHDVFLWWQENIMSTKAEESDKDLSGIKKEYWVAKTRVEVVKAETLEEKYLPRGELGNEWAYRAGIYRAGLLAFASRLPPLLVGKTILQMRKVLTDEASLLLAALSQDHKFCPWDKLPKEYTTLDKIIAQIAKCKPKRKQKSSGKPKKRS